MTFFFFAKHDLWPFISGDMVPIYLNKSVNFFICIIVILNYIYEIINTNTINI